MFIINDKKTSINQKYACSLLYYLLECAHEPHPICSASFNVILEGLFREKIHMKNDSSFYNQSINYKNRCFYITKIQTEYRGKTAFLPILKDDNINNLSNSIHIKSHYDDFYIYYDLETKTDGHHKQPLTASIPRLNKRTIAVSNFYAIVTKKHFFIQENQYLKALLFKMLFNSKSNEDGDKTIALTNGIIDKANQLLKKRLEDSKNKEMTPIAITKDVKHLEPYLICNAFIDTFNLLENDSKQVIREIYNENHRNTKL